MNHRKEYVGRAGPLGPPNLSPAGKFRRAQRSRATCNLLSIFRYFPS
jgi:hypothetical protein